MAGSVNKVILVGNVGKDPEIRRTQDGRPIASLSIATSETWRDKASGEKREKTEWHKISVFSEGLCKVIESYVKKGAKLYIEGQLQTRKWTDQSGQDRYSTEVVLQGYNCALVMLDGGGKRQDGDTWVDQDQSESVSAYATQAKGDVRQPPKGYSKKMDDEIPFGVALMVAIGGCIHAIGTLAGVA